MRFCGWPKRPTKRTFSPRRKKHSHLKTRNSTQARTIGPIAGQGRRTRSPRRPDFQGRMVQWRAGRRAGATTGTACARFSCRQARYCGRVGNVRARPPRAGSYLLRQSWIGRDPAGGGPQTECARMDEPRPPPRFSGRRASEEKRRIRHNIREWLSDPVAVPRRRWRWLRTSAPGAAR